MQRTHQSRPQSDPRIVLYRISLRAAAIVVIVVAVKLLLLDVILVKGDAMAPSIVRGDRVLVLRMPYLPLLREIKNPGRGNSMILSLPAENRRGCLRIAGVSGDMVMVDSGAFRNLTSTKRFPMLGRPPEEPLLPPEFSQRDFMPAVRVPAPGDTLGLDTPDLFRLFWNIAVVRQENEGAVFLLKPQVVIDSSAVGGYSISGFALYKGPLDSVPPQNRYDWFFWNRLREYLRQTHSGHTVDLTFAVSQNGAPLKQYRVKDRYVFVLADNWKNGLDSRYFGPVSHHRLFGRPLAVLWSFTGRNKGGSAFNFKRLGKILR